MTGVEQVPMSTTSSQFIKAGGRLLQQGVLRPDIMGVAEDSSSFDSTKNGRLLSAGGGPLEAALSKCSRFDGAVVMPNTPL